MRGAGAAKELLHCHGLVPYALSLTFCSRKQLSFFTIGLHWLDISREDSVEIPRLKTCNSALKKQWETLKHWDREQVVSRLSCMSCSNAVPTARWAPGATSFPGIPWDSMRPRQMLEILEWWSVVIQGFPILIYHDLSSVLMVAGYRNGEKWGKIILDGWSRGPMRVTCLCATHCLVLMRYLHCDAWIGWYD